MWVKICANTTATDALEAARLGADAVGFVFAPSTRQVTAAQVREIAQQLPSTLERVGVFGALPPDEIASIAQHALLTTIQLHAGYDPTVTSRLRQLLGDDFQIIETVHWVLDQADAQANVASALSAIAAASPGSRVLIDSKLPASPRGASGGTGQSFDWQRARAVFTSQPGLRLILAGGLRPDTVAEAIHTLHPWGVDVASGVEAQPGLKDPARLAAFIKNARQA